MRQISVRATVIGMVAFFFVLTFATAVCRNSVDIPAPATPTPSSVTASGCQGMEHVYNPQRLTVLAACVHVVGVITAVRHEPDGDYHIRFHPDDPTHVWINSTNTSQQHGDLVTEPVCVSAPTQADAVEACTDYRYTGYIPRVGDHVVVNGPWVLDTAHGWLEIHPATYERYQTGQACFVITIEGCT